MKMHCEQFMISLIRLSTFQVIIDRMVNIMKEGGMSNHKEQDMITWSNYTWLHNVLEEI